MASYKFAIGEQVVFLPQATDYNVPRGVYTIVRQLPFERNTCSYRVKNSVDGHERVIQESQLDRR